VFSIDQLERAAAVVRSVASYALELFRGIPNLALEGYFSRLQKRRISSSDA
jgi:hypothetical protein